MEKKECFGEMERNRMECKSCPLQTKIACFTETAKEGYGVSGDCLTAEGRAVCYSDRGSCDHPKIRQDEFMSQACQFLGKLSAYRKNNCPNFGTLNLSFDINRIKICSECEESLYKKCEIVETNLRKFPHLAYESTIREDLENEIRMTEDDGACLGSFEFNETDCFKECDFKITCLRKTGIKERPPFDSDEMPNYLPVCKYFPSFDEINANKDHDYFEKTSPENFMKELCSKCPFEQNCKDFILSVRDWIINEKFKRVIFTNFYTLRQIRKALMKA